MNSVLLTTLCILLLTLSPTTAQEPCERVPLEQPGEFPLSEVQPLDELAQSQLQRLVATEPEARAWVDAARRAAEPVVGCQPRPLVEIFYEGLLHTDPRRVETVAALREMEDVVRMLRHWRVSGDPDASAWLQRFVLAWSSTYVATGNDVNENKLLPIFVAYHDLRDDFNAHEQRRIEVWIRSIAVHHRAAMHRDERFSNRDMKSVRLVAIAGLILDEPEWQSEAQEAVRRFVRASLRGDGTSHDLEERDALSYHMSALKPAIQIAILGGVAGAELYRWENAEGGSIAKSVAFVVPFASGERVREEWTRSRVDLDRRRAEAGLSEYAPGRRFEPTEALELIELASVFDPELEELAVTLAEAKGEGAADRWQILMNRAHRMVLEPPERASQPGAVR